MMDHQYIKNRFPRWRPILITVVLCIFYKSLAYLRPDEVGGGSVLALGLGVKRTSSSSSSPSSSAAAAAAASSLGLDTRREFHIPFADLHIPPDTPVPLPEWYFNNKKYYVESELDFHYIRRYTTAEIIATLGANHFLRASLFRHIFTAFAKFADTNHVKYWLAHGTLLGQIWGEKILTYDFDLDLQLTLESLRRLQPFNQTLIEGRFLLDINPHYLIRYSRNIPGEQFFEGNVIDARFIDTKTGSFIDLTALSFHSDDQFGHVNSTGSIVDLGKGDGLLHDKSIHNYTYDDISPLYRCMYEDVETWCPAHTAKVLGEEYKRFQSPYWDKYRYSTQSRLFEPLRCDRLYKMYNEPDPRDCDSDCQEVVSHDRYQEWREWDWNCILRVDYEGESRLYEGTKPRFGVMVLEARAENKTLSGIDVNGR